MFTFRSPRSQLHDMSRPDGMRTEQIQATSGRLLLGMGIAIALILALAAEKEGKTRNILWHRALALADRQANFSLNPRLQLENLFVGE